MPSACDDHAVAINNAMMIAATEE